MTTQSPPPCRYCGTIPGVSSMISGTPVIISCAGLECSEHPWVTGFTRWHALELWREHAED